MIAYHTPGPWAKKDRLNGEIEIRPVPPAKGSTLGFAPLAKVFGDKRMVSKAEMEANARLIAAAPDLLEALKELLDQDDHGEDEIWVRNKARAAIAKAEGGEA